MEVNFEKLIGSRFSVGLGSGTTTCVWSSEDLLGELIGVIRHKFFDSDFYFNWTDNSEEYSKVFRETTILPLIKTIKENLDTLFEFRTTSYSTREILLLRKDVFEGKTSEVWIDNWFQTNKMISVGLRKDYYYYREQYAGVLLD